MSKVKIGIFGGSFDPFHNDHFRLAKKVYERCWLDSVWLMPTYKYDGKESTNAEIRLHMLRETVEGLRVRGYNWIKVSDIDIINKFTQSYETVSHLKQKYPNLEFYFICGEDTALDIHNWKNCKELISQIPFIVINRHSTCNKFNLGTWYQDYPHRIINIKSSLSSTIIRNKIINGDISWKYDVLPGTEVFIKKHKLYKKELINV